MKLLVLHLVLCVTTFAVYALSSDEITEVTETCCHHGESFAVSSTSGCSAITPPDGIESEQLPTCAEAMNSCCEEQIIEKKSCSEGIKQAATGRCSMPNNDIGTACCEDCAFGSWTGKSQGKGACGQPADNDDIPSSAFRKNAFYQCCLEAAEKPETTTEKKVETTTEKQRCKEDSCEHLCNDSEGVVRCQCRDGFRLQGDKKSCKDINECLESLDDLCTVTDTVCHNTPGAFKCVPLKKREVGSCPPGFKRNVLNQVCDDINECQLPRPPCPKYLCENIIGGYKCAGKPGKPFEETGPGEVEAPDSSTEPPKNDICPPGFRAGPDDECIDIDECDEHLDDCQRLSQHCINTHGAYFCQDHVSKRCAPGFKVNKATGICEDIDECEESSEVCKRTETCINLPGAYNCKSKIPKLSTKKCQEGTRTRPGGKICEDIDECREGTHLCDQFQNCINTYGGHECRCKNGFELDSSSGSCVDIDECALKLDNCGSGLNCLNVLGSFTCTRQSTTTTPAPFMEYEYYDEDDNSTDISEVPDAVPPTTSTSTTRRPTTPRLTTTSTRRPTTPKPTTTSTTRRPYYPYPDRFRYYTTSTTTIKPIVTRPVYPSRRPEYPVTKPNESPSRPVDTPPRPEYPVNIPTVPSNEEQPNIPENEPIRPEIPNEYPSKPDNLQPYPENIPSPGNAPARPEESPRRPDNRRPENEVSRPFYPSRRTDDYPRRPAESPRQPEYPRTYDPNYRPTTPKRPEPTLIIPKEPTTSTTVMTPERENKSNTPLFNPNEVYCLHGYEKDHEGNCVDVDECQGTHICSNLERCINRPGGYICECVPGFRQNDEGWCVPIPVTSTSTTSTTTTSTTTESTTAVATPPGRPYTPYRPSGGRAYPTIPCELGYKFDSSVGRCVDVDECALNTAKCSPKEDCINIEGGYSCVCGSRCRGEENKPTYGTPVYPEPSPPAAAAGRQPETGTNVITVGAQYGQRGAWSPRPSYTRLPDTGSIVASCPWGYKLTPDKRCFDVDECASNSSDCGPMQRCENFYGGYSCQCPAGHRLVGQNGCDDIDECMHGNPCSYNAHCVNTVGSYRCMCEDGFRNAPTNDKVCVDVDECSESPGVCHQGCANAWGGYRCFCKRGYRLNNDNRTCVDVNECEEWGSVRTRGKLCGGECVNEPGSYRCACPAGYRLSDDTKSCIDIDECETGEATCAYTTDPGYVCQNTRGSYHCHHIECPTGYKLESKHRCTRVQRYCPMSDWACLQQPSTYSYNFITFVANIYLPSGSVDLFTMHGPTWSESIVSFEMRMVDVQAAPGVTPADLRCFDMRPASNICVISLLCPLAGPQVAELELIMSLYQRGQFAGSAVARLVVIVSEYEF